MATRYIRRGSSLGSQTGLPAASPIFVDADTDTVKVVPASSGTTEVSLIDSASAQTISGVKTFSALPVVSADGGLQFAEVVVSSAELLALNATPKTIVAAPGAGKVLVPVALAVIMDYGTVAYNGIAAGEDLVLRYTDGSGAAAFTVEATGFLDQASDQLRLGGVEAAAAAAITPVANAALVLHMATGEIATGDSPLRVKVWYTVFSTGL